MFQTATPFVTPRLMTDLVAWANREREADRLHPLLVIVLCVVVFLEIHPFRDGNGRLSRVPTMLLLLQAGYAYVPYSSLENVVEQNKEAYYMALRQTQGRSARTRRTGRHARAATLHRGVRPRERNPVWKSQSPQYGAGLY